MDYIERIEALGACAPALDWLRSEQHPTLQAAWDACPRSNWMLWLLLKRADAAYAAARDAAVIARLAARDAAARDAAYAAADAAARDAYAAARDAYAARDAADAARAAAYDAADAAYDTYAAARDAARDADAIRAIVPVAPTLP